MSSEEPERPGPKREPGLEASWDILAKPEYESMQHIDKSKIGHRRPWGEGDSASDASATLAVTALDFELVYSPNL